MTVIKSFIKYFNDMNTRKKLLVSYILVVFIPVLFVGLLLSFSMRSMATQNAIKEANGNVVRVTKRIQEVFNIPIVVSMKFYGSSSLENIIYQEYNSDWDIIQTYFNYNEFDELKTLYKEVEEIRLFVPNEAMIDNWRFVPTTESIKAEIWYQEAMASKGKIIWCYMDLPGKAVSDPSLSMIRVLKTDSGKLMGVLVVKLNENAINDILRQESFETIVVDEDGLIIAAQESSIAGQEVDSVELEIIPNEVNEVKDLIYKGKPSKMISNTFMIEEGAKQFKVISIFYMDEILAVAKKTTSLAVIVTISSLIFSLGLILLFSRALSKRINQVSHDMHRVANGDFEFTSSIDGNDEVGQLSKDLNIMLHSIKRLMSEIYDTNIQKQNLLVKQKEIRFKMLANQINPHFLFNALEAIRMEAVNEGVNNIARIIKLLGKIMRTSLKVGNETVSLENELSLVESYLEIQKFRYSDKLEYTIEVSNPEYLSYAIMPFTIQPIVENAIIHGLENKEGKGAVIVKIESCEEVMMLSVQDDGMGMKADDLLYLLESFDEPDNSREKRIGLRNIHQRVKLFYGEKFGIQITSEQNKGTTVIIRLPMEGGYNV